ncbi:MAG: DUF4398 domain-containing protein [Proteobacteria bacterium]|nr:DUF4398 domain-containing protein [Pseudomonadota bacterium]MBU1715636.1 DUF4398 domain-containing protein [Pseudomonadota bacterium]
MKRNKVSQYLLIGLAALGLGLVGGCATKDTVSSRFPALEDNISAAKAAEAEVYAPTPLEAAEEKLEAARLAVQAKDMLTANTLVDEAMVDADYARAAASTAKAKNEAMVMRQAIQKVRAEIELLAVN